MNPRPPIDHAGPPPVIVQLVGTPTPALLDAMWRLGLRPVAGTTGPAIWAPPGRTPR